MVAMSSARDHEHRLAQAPRHRLGQGRYIIDDVLHANGARAVLVAHRDDLPQSVLLERISGLSAAALRRALAAQASLLALAHPNLARPIECFVEDGALHVVMVVGPGALLSDPRGIVSQDEALTIGAALCNVLGYLAWRGLAHCPMFEPGTVYVTSAGRVKVTNLAALLGVRVPRSRSPFAAPAAHPTPALFGVGAVLHYLLIGWPCRYALGAPDLATLRPDLAPDLCEVIQRALAPTAGWATPADLRYALLQIPEK